MLENGGCKNSPTARPHSFSLSFSYPVSVNVFQPETTGNIFVVDQIYLVLIAKRDHTLGRILGCLTVKDIMKDFIGFVHCLGKLRKGSRKKGFAFIVCCLGQW